MRATKRKRRRLRIGRLFEGEAKSFTWTTGRDKKKRVGQLPNCANTEGCSFGVRESGRKRKSLGEGSRQKQIDQEKYRGSEKKD